MSKILIDFDSTLADMDKARYTAMNEKFGTSYDAKGQTHWHNEVSGYLDPKHEAWFWNKMWTTDDFHSHLEPVKGAVESVKKLREMGHDLMVVSDRNPQLFDVTRAWLDAQGLDMVRLLFTRSKHSQNREGTMMTKAQAAWRHGLTIVIEDSPYHAPEMCDRSWIDKVYLINYNYNRDVPPHEKLVRVNNWKEILRDLS